MSTTSGFTLAVTLSPASECPTTVPSLALVGITVASVMSHDDVLSALAILKRHGKLDDSFFFATVLGDPDSLQPERKKKHLFLPSIQGISEMGVRNGEHTLLACIDGKDGVWCHFTDQASMTAFMDKWRLAKLAAMLYG